MSSGKKYSKGAALALAGLFGPFGVDKFYVGLPELGLIQILLTITVIGMVITLPWSAITIIGLVLSILFGASTLLYPGVEWEETTVNDQVVAWIIVGVYVFGLLASIVSSAMNTSSTNAVVMKTVESFNTPPQVAATPVAPLPYLTPGRSGTPI